jgi:hypothetical protein
LKTYITTGKTRGPEVLCGASGTTTVFESLLFSDPSVAIGVSSVMGRELESSTVTSEEKLP